MGQFNSNNHASGSKSYAIGIDIGGTYTVLGLIERSGRVVQTLRFPTRESTAYIGFLDVLSRHISALLEQVGDRLQGIGIGAPNGNLYNGCIEQAPNLPFGEVLPLRNDLQQRFDIPIVLTNDANAAAMGEHLFGGAVGMDDFFMITLGTGVGSGIFTQGKLLYGSTGFAGEIGHAIVEHGGRQCNCGRCGCLETYASATGVVYTAEMYLRETETTSLLRGMGDTFTAKDVYAAAVRGDKLALQVFDFTADKLALGLANAAVVTSPKVIFLYGGLSESGDLLLKPLKKYFEHYLFTPFQGKISFQYSALPKETAALLGAAAMAYSL